MWSYDFSFVISSLVTKPCPVKCCLKDCVSGVICLSCRLLSGKQISRGGMLFTRDEKHNLC